MSQKPTGNELVEQKFCPKPDCQRVHNYHPSYYPDGVIKCKQCGHVFKV
jgi:hypothetical protein